jgi:hypothetical protein
MTQVPKKEPNTNDIIVSITDAVRKVFSDIQNNNPYGLKPFRNLYISESSNYLPTYRVNDN